MSEKILPGLRDKFIRTVDMKGTIQINFGDLTRAGMHPAMLSCFAGMNKRYNQGKESEEQ
jgi:hypothetical protein